MNKSISETINYLFTGKEGLKFIIIIGASVLLIIIALILDFIKDKKRGNK